jgi:hypothetical protein
VKKPSNLRNVPPGQGDGVLGALKFFIIRISKRGAIKPLGPPAPARQTLVVDDREYDTTAKPANGFHVR